MRHRLLSIENNEQIRRRLARHELAVGLTEGLVEEAEPDAEVFLQDELVVIAWPSDRLAEKSLSCTLWAPIGRGNSPDTAS
jgi:hypothetical protein